MRKEELFPEPDDGEEPLQGRGDPLDNPADSLAVDPHATRGASAGDDGVRLEEPAALSARPGTPDLSQALTIEEYRDAMAGRERPLTQDPVYNHGAGDPGTRKSVEQEGIETRKTNSLTDAALSSIMLSEE